MFWVGLIVAFFTDPWSKLLDKFGSGVSFGYCPF
jgi:hypothetical protein